MPKRSKPFLSLLIDDLTDPDEAASYLRAAWEDSDEMFLEAFRDVAQAHEVATVARKSGTTRENLYRAFCAQGNPTLKTLSAALHAAGLKLDVRPIEDDASTVPPPTVPRQRTGSRKRRGKLVSGTGQMKLAFAIEPGGAGISAMPSALRKQDLGRRQSIPSPTWFASTVNVFTVMQQHANGSAPTFQINQKNSAYSARVN